MSGDAYYQNVSLLLHCDGTDGSTTFTDSSPTPKTVTASGNAHIETDQAKFGTASAYFDGTGDYLTYPNDAAFSFGTGDFTIECWAYLSTVTGQISLINIGSYNLSSGIILYVQDGKIRAYSPAIDAVETTASVSINTWHHLAWSRASGTLRMFVDGAEKYEASYTSTLASSADNEIGRDSINNNAYMTGYLDDIRITKGVARYTETFTPAAAAFPDYAGQIAGVITDDASEPVARVVRAYRRDTGALVGNTTSSAVDGSYSMNFSTLPGECSIIALDDASGDLFNDLIARVTPA